MSKKSDFVIVGNTIRDYLGDEEKIVIPEGTDEIVWSLRDKDIADKITEVVIPSSIKYLFFGTFYFPNLCKIEIAESSFEHIGENGIKGAFNYKQLGQKLLEGKAEYSECIEKEIIAYVKEKKNRKLYMESAIGTDLDIVVKNMLIYVKKLKLDEIDMWIKKAESSNSKKCMEVLKRFKNDLYSEVYVEKHANDKVLKETGKKELSVSEWKAIYTLSKTSKGICLKKYKGSEESIVVPSYIGKDRVIALEGTFQGCKFIKNVILPEEIISLGQNTFAGCISLESIIIPQSVEIIYKKSFARCTGLKSIEFLGNTELGKLVAVDCGIFEGCSSLEKIVIPQCVTAIFYDMFKNCTSLKEVVFNSELKWISDNAFSGCSSLNIVDLPNSLETISSGAFKDCVELKNLKLPQGIREIENNAFKGCDNITLSVAEGSYGEQYAIKRKISYTTY